MDHFLKNEPECSGQFCVDVATDESDGVLGPDSFFDNVKAVILNRVFVLSLIIVWTDNTFASNINKKIRSNPKIRISKQISFLTHNLVVALKTC